MSAVAKLQLLFLAAAAVLMPLALYAVFFVAPVELEMGLAQKVFYMHVAAAMTMILHFVAAGLLSLLFLLKPRPSTDAMAAACADVGTVMAALVLGSGPLWARKAWGTWWEFEPRLTLTLLVFLLYLGYAALRRFAGNESFSLRLAAGVSALSLPAIYFIHVAVKLWGGHHPPNMAKGAYATDPEMRLALLLSIAAMLCLSLTLTTLRARIRMLDHTHDALWREVQDADLDLEPADA